MTPAALSLARRVRELLAEPGRWTQGWRARDVRGTGCEPRSKHAVRWCLIGAMQRKSRTGSVIGELDMELRGRLRMSPERWNDNFAAHADVLALLDRVIEDGER